MNPDTVHRTTLSNGLTLLVQQDRTAPVVAIVTWVKAGYFDETDDENGLSHALEHMFFKGTAKRGVGEIAKATKGIGGYLNAHTIYDNTAYYTVLPSSGFAKGLEIQADAYANSTIDAGELAKEMEVIIQEAKRKSDNPSAVATETLYELLHDQHRMRRWRIGREDGLRSFTREKMTSFYRNFYRPANTILSISGDIDVEDAIARVTELFGGLESNEPVRKPGPAEPDHAGFRYRELSGDIAQSQLVVGWRTPGTLHPDTPALDVAASLLATGRASRLYRAVRERKLASTISAYDYTPTELGVFVVHAETEPEKIVDAARAIWHELRVLRDERAEHHELERVRRIFEARWVRRLETAEGRANYLAEWEALGDWRLGQNYFDRFMSVDGEQVQRVVSTHLPAQKAAAIIYRPEGAPVIAGDATAMQALLERGRVEPLSAIPARQLPSPRRIERASFDREEWAVSIFRTRNGVPILLRRKPGAAMAHVALYIAGGSAEEPADLAGLTLLTARTVLKGTTSRSAAQIAEDAEMLGATISGGASSDSFGWSFSLPKSRLAQGLELLGDVVQHPTIPDDALETERAAALSSVSMMRDDMYRYPMKLASEAAFLGHPYGVPTMGTDRSLRAISAQNVRDWHRTRILTSAAAIGIVADLEPAAVADLVANELGEVIARDAPSIARPQWPRRAEAVAETRDKAQTALAVAFPAPTRTDDTRFAASLIATVASGLGGRFFDELRDRQSLAYTVQAGMSERRAAGMFLSYIATSPEKEEIARAGLLAEFDKLRNEEVTAEELSRAKEYMVGSHAISQESGGAMLGELLDAWMFGSGLSELDQYDTRVRAVTADQMRNVARTYFNLERRIEGIVRGVERTV
ncbi:MAG: pitrilysin family protein [Gemmatimonadaceae bacterium]